MGRFGWIMAGAAAVVGGWIYHDRASIRWGDHDGDRVTVEDRRDARIDSAVDRIVDRETRRGDGSTEIDGATAKALALAVGGVVRAEARLAKLELVGSASPAEIAAARAERDRAEAEVDRLEAQIEGRSEPQSERDRLREEIRAEVRDEVRAELRNKGRGADRSN